MEVKSKDRINQKKILTKDLEQNKEQLLKDIDTEVRDFFQDHIKLYVIENKDKIKVPIKIATPERWKQMKEEHYLRDNKKQVMLPLCLIKRNDIRIIEDRYIMPHLRNMVTVMEGIPEENKTQNYNKRKDYSYKNKYYVQIEPPTAIELTYDIQLQTRYMSSLNSLIEQISMNKNKGRIVNDDGIALKWEIGSFGDNSNVEDFSDELRIISNNFDFTVETILYDKYKNNQLNVVKKFTPHKITLKEVIE